jgi:hypothetical protein
VTIVGAVGGVVAARGPRADVELRLRYVESVGIFATYEDGAVFGSASEPGRLVSTGVEVRPLFFARWLQGNETNGAWLDLALDSVGLELGMTFLQPAGTGFASLAGMELGLGAELPLQAGTTGLWVGFHAGLRWSDSALDSGVVRNADDRSAFLAISLAWHQSVVAHLVDVGDRAPR